MVEVDIGPGGNVVRSAVSAIPQSAYQPITAQEVSGLAIPLSPSAPPPTIDAPLESDIQRYEAGTDADRAVEVMVTFKENLQIPRFPKMIRSQPRASAANQTILQQSAQLVASIKGARAPVRTSLANALVSNHGAKVIETFWLINAMVLELPLSQARSVAARGDVQALEYTHKHTPPPDNTLAAACLDMNLCLYYNTTTSGFIALLDTGVRSTHTLFNNPNTLASVMDCTTGLGDGCIGGTDGEDYHDHGTCSASELSGNSNLNASNRGLTQIQVDSYKVYTFCVQSCGYYVPAGLRAFQAAVYWGDYIVDAEIQDTTGYLGATATAADAAYDAGLVVVAAAGNSGPSAGTCLAPGNAKKALAIGAVDVQTQLLQSYSSRGPTSDGRVKPDLTGPTNVMAADNSSDTAMSLFQGTSAATPNATGAVAVMYDYFNFDNWSYIDPGAINVMMIANGNNKYVDNNVGAGLPLMRSPSGTAIWYGVYSVSPGQTVTIPINIQPQKTIDAALWWPESETQVHNHIALNLYRPNGKLAAQSNMGQSIFQKVQASGSLPTGTWTVKAVPVTGNSIQTVYFTLWNRP